MFDYVADLGDGFDPTMAVAWQLTAPSSTCPHTPPTSSPPLPGRCPGVRCSSSAATRCTRGRRPLYVAGGFGGAAGIVALALDGTLTTEQMQALGSTRVGERSYDDVADAQRSSLPDGVPVTVGEMLAGLTGRRPVNGLSDEENARPARTSNLDEMIGLVLRGLRTVRGG